ncbi:LysR family transcriptional regulator [Rhodovulum sulfidophilum]|uniref:LysR family transcriptional regulator n=1 Tax=Rhodovulum sulfidophilum TaxID=35806 RepID=UPI0013899F89|nr:LysR family transcriptional regulator [Rhodovulum sulfidophilum]NDK33869.1 LysR family transcriptional regulator [Rhodovulum sulfidophilum]
MNIAQLETFLELSDCLNVTETAARMNCTQPAVSARIRGLEQSLDAPLFDRIGKRMHLTANGILFLDYARKAVGALQEASEHLRQMDDPLTGTIRFGASNFTGIYLMPAFLGRYRQAAPDLEFELEIASSAQLLADLDTAKLEFLILSDHIAVDERRYQCRHICNDEMVLVVPPAHPLAKVRTATLANLSQDVFLMKPPPSASRSFLLDRIQGDDSSLGRVMYISSTEAIKQGVLHGLGISVLSRFVVAQELADGRLKEVPMTLRPFRRGIRAINLRDKLLTPAASEFIKRLVESGGRAEALPWAAEGAPGRPSHPPSGSAHSKA